MEYRQLPLYKVSRGCVCAASNLRRRFPYGEIEHVSAGIQSRMPVVDAGSRRLDWWGGRIHRGVAWQWTWWVGFVIAFVVAHFFLFCNIFRMSRPLELVWAAAFVAAAGGTVVTETPGWGVTVVGSLIVTVLVVAIEMRRPSYHGIAWQQLNPKLPEWWEAHIAKHATDSNEKD